MSGQQRVNAHQNRRGFSMLELLAVIGIIALVLSTFGLMMANFAQGARVQATRATISKIDAILKERMDAFRKQDFTAAGQQLLNMGSVSDLEAGKALAFKQAFRVAFPQQAADNSRAPFDKITNLPASNSDAESAAYLYVLITKGKTYGTPTVDDTAFTTSEVQTVNEVSFFIDAWGQPLHYYRSPTRLFWLGEDVNNNGSLDTAEDDTDGDGDVTPTPTAQLALAQARLILAPSVRFVQAGSAVHPLRIDTDDRLNRLRSMVLNSSVFDSARWNNFELFFQTPSTYSTPLIVSAGPDRELGLQIPLNGTGAGVAASRRALPIAAVLSGDTTPLNDNITNLNLQSLGGN